MLSSDSDMIKHVSGAQALARAALESGVSVVTGYAGSPVTPVVNEILAATSPHADENQRPVRRTVEVHWASNEKTAIEMAFGASLGGARAMLCVKGVGLNVGLDPLMAFNLTGCNAGLILLVGDDPGAWGSQNEQDSRALALAAEIPLLEPTSVPDAWAAMGRAFELSEHTGLPVMVRITRALVLAEADLDPKQAMEGFLRGAPPPFQREFMRWIVLPINAVPYHRRLHERLEAVRARFEASPLNRIKGDGPYKVIAAGFTYRKLMDALAGTVPPELSILRLGTIHPFPTQRVLAFLRSIVADLSDEIKPALILEETAPWVEQAVRATVQAAGLTTRIYGRETGHIACAGELFAAHIAAVLNDLVPGLTLPIEGGTSRPLPSRQPLCEHCPYIPTFDALTEVMDRMGGRDRFVLVGDPGCMVRAQLPPYELLDVKNSLGSSIGTAAGLAMSARRTGAARQIVALSGDSSFLHSGLAGLIDATRFGINMLVILLDNGTTALSGGQPHPASRVDARGRPQPAVDLAALARQAGAGLVQVVDLDRGDDARPAIEAGMQFKGVAVVIARGECRR
jgi:indolepyruvate ferredoxin oxidoreductase alpha subunit